MLASDAGSRTAYSVAAMLLALACAAPVHADSSVAEQRLRDQLRQTTLELRQTQDENAELKAKLDSMAQQAAAAAPKEKADSPQLRRELKEQLARATHQQQQIDTLQRALDQSQQGYQNAATLARTRDADAKKLEAQLAEADAQAHSCTANNEKLVGVADNLLLRYKNKGVIESMRDSEPLTGLDRIELERLAQDYHIQIVNLTVPRQAVATP